MKPLDTREAGTKLNIRMRLTLYYRSYMFLNYSTCGTFKMVSFSKSEDNQYTSIEEIKRLKVQEPKTILSDHGQPVTGKKADLVHGFLVSLPYVSRLSRYPFLSKSNTTFAISPLFTNKLWGKLIHTGLALVWCTILSPLHMYPAVSLEMRRIRKWTIMGRWSL